MRSLLAMLAAIVGGVAAAVLYSTTPITEEDGPQAAQHAVPETERQLPTATTGTDSSGTAGKAATTEAGGQDELARLSEKYALYTRNPDWSGFESELLARVEAGDSRAMLWLATFYGMPESPMRDTTRAMAMLEKAWQLGEIEAAETLAVLHIEHGMTNDDAAAIQRGMQWMESAAGAGSVNAKRTLAHLYADAEPELGVGDRARGLYWAQDYGASVPANEQVYVAQGVIRGRGYVQDFNTGIDMMIQSGQRGEPGSLNDAAWILATCQGETPARLSEATALMEEEFSRYGRTSGSVDTLAAVYARMGDYQRAIAAQLDAIRLLEEEGVTTGDPRYAAFHERLNIYNAGKTVSSSYPCEAPGR